VSNRGGLAFKESLASSVYVCMVSTRRFSRCTSLPCPVNPVNHAWHKKTHTRRDTLPDHCIYDKSFSIKIGDAIRLCRSRAGQSKRRTNPGAKSPWAQIATTKIGNESIGLDMPQGPNRTPEHGMHDHPNLFFCFHRRRHQPPASLRPLPDPPLATTSNHTYY